METFPFWQKQRYQLGYSCKICRLKSWKETLMPLPKISAVTLQPLLPVGRQQSTDRSAGWLGFGFQSSKPHTPAVLPKPSELMWLFWELNKVVSRKHSARWSAGLKGRINTCWLPFVIITVLLVVGGYILIFQNRSGVSSHLEGKTLERLPGISKANWRSLDMDYRNETCTPVLQ